MHICVFEYLYMFLSDCVCAYTWYAYVLVNTCAYLHVCTWPIRNDRVEGQPTIISPG